MELHEHFSKQSYRNRCTILTANGLLDLTAPVAHDGASKSPIAETRLAYDMPWQQLHFKAIESAYRRSPFYDFYIDELKPFFTERFPKLYAFNRQIIDTVVRLIGLHVSIRESKSYEAQPTGMQDFRNTIHPKAQKQQADPQFTPRHYTQVFADRFGFQANLSVLDLLFNVGPDSRDLLMQS